MIIIFDYLSISIEGKRPTRIILENHGCKFTRSWETAIKPTCVCCAIVCVNYINLHKLYALSIWKNAQNNKNTIPQTRLTPTKVSDDIDEAINFFDRRLVSKLFNNNPVAIGHMAQPTRTRKQYSSKHTQTCCIVTSYNLTLS
jgi:hypothetical protein